MKTVVEGSLEFIETFHGWALWGKSPSGSDVFIAETGDIEPKFDPNADPIMGEAYGFETVSEE